MLRPSGWRCVICPTSVEGAAPMPPAPAAHGKDRRPNAIDCHPSVFHSLAAAADRTRVQQVLATAFVALTVLGAALYLAGAIASVLRLWLLRQLYESQQQAEQLAEAVRGSQV